MFSSTMLSTVFKYYFVLSFKANLKSPAIMLCFIAIILQSFSTCSVNSMQHPLSDDI